MASTNVTVVVLGDIGRSPRMQYHASSLLQEGFNVQIIGYGGSKPLRFLQLHNNCLIHHLPQVPQFNKKFPMFVAYLFKILWQICTLTWALMRSRRCEHLLVQTPPAIPVISVCWLYCRLMGSKFIIDWHNYAFSIMALTHGENHQLVKLSERLEGDYGRKSNGNLCVTKAMKDDLLKRWNIRAVTLYDRPPDHFGSITANDRQTLVAKYSELSSAGLVDEAGELRPERPGLLVSSTSWTEDEDFSILLSALREYELIKDADLPKLLCVITGKGPLRDLYMRRVRAQDWGKVTIVSLWLEAEDYPLLLASADLGVSLHTSSSGLDLPMKIVDMFGCGLPVAALHFSCLNELVRHQENGLVFRDSCELSQQLQDWFRGFPSNDTREKFRNGIQEFQSLRWHDNWKIQALPLFARH